MGQEYMIGWVGERTRTDQRGNTVYSVALNGYDAAKTVKVVRKPETPAPQVNETIYGSITVYDNETRDGEKYQTHRFYSEQRPDSGSGGNSASGEGRARGSSDSPGPEFWAQKDRRLARAGMTQAVVASGAVNLAVDGDLNTYVATVGRITDALLADLERRTPSPNNTPPSEPVPGKDAQTGTLASNGGNGAESGATPPAPAPSPPSDDDLKLALAACGHDNANPQATYAALNPDQKAQVNLVHSNLKSKGEATIPDDRPGGEASEADARFHDPEEVPF